MTDQMPSFEAATANAGDRAGAILQCLKEACGRTDTTRPSAAAPDNAANFDTILKLFRLARFA